MKLKLQFLDQKLEKHLIKLKTLKSIGYNDKISYYIFQRRNGNLISISCGTVNVFEWLNVIRYYCVN